MRTKKSGWVTFINLLIAALLIGMALYTLLRPFHFIVQITTIAVSAAIACVLIWLGGRSARQQPEKNEEIVKIVLIDEDGERLKEWFVRGETSVLIGKTSSRGEVDIDLSDCEYASLVSPEHAVLNRVAGRWFIEDAESTSGTGIRKSGRSDSQRLIVEEPMPVGVGDMLFIANTRLLVK